MGNIRFVKPMQPKKKSENRVKIVAIYEPPVKCMPFDSAEFDLSGCFETSHKLICDNYTEADKDYRLYLLPEAAKTMMSFIGWGTWTRQNVVEQAGILAGYHFEDKEQGVFFEIVKQAIPFRQSKGTEVFIKITPEEWGDMDQELEQMNAELEKEGKDPMIVLGWFHTHPNELDVFMSGIDRETQSSLYQKDGSMAIVLNPHRKIWKCFRSAECRNVRAEMLIGNVHPEEINNGKNSYY